jgi:TRAP-type mannitol/chloroaromatic compound transport system substrate-binding protein
MRNHISRKDFLRRGSAALAGTALLGTACGQSSSSAPSASPLDPSQTFEWKMVTTWPPNFPVLGEGCNLFAKWVEEMSGGRLKISVYGGGELVPPLEVFDTVSAGTAELGNGAAYYWAGKVPAAQFFASVPFGMNAQQMNAWLISGGGQALWDEVYAPFNLKGFPSGNTGVQMGGWFNREINSLADLQGLKMRIPGIGGKVITQAGGSAVNVAGGEIYTNLERGVIDATEWIGPYHDYKMGFHKIARYYYYPGWHEPGTTMETLVNQAKFESLPPDLQAILVAGIQRQNIWTLSTFEAENNSYLKKMIEEGVELRAFPDEVLTELRRLTEEVLAELTEEDEMSRKVYEAFQAFKQNAQEWSQVTEKVFHNSLNQG